LIAAIVCDKSFSLQYHPLLDILWMYLKPAISHIFSNMSLGLFQKECNFIFSVTQKGKHPKTNLPEIAFLGKSNVGKSSIINAILNTKKLVRTSNTPGSTIKINYFNLADKLLLVDLPGYGYAKRAKHMGYELSSLVEDYLRNRVNLKRLIFIIDARRGVQEREIELLHFFQDLGNSVLIVINKIDKLNKSEIEKVYKDIKLFLTGFKCITDIVSTSCSKGYGIKKLKERIIKW
jgi:GTP-binding protein